MLSSSPRKGGNSDLLCDRFISGAKETGHDTEKIFLKDKEINYYRGCGTCLNKNKQFHFIATAADSSKPAIERTFEGFRCFTSCLDGAIEKGTIYGTGAWNIGDIKDKPAMQEAYYLGFSV